MISRLRALAFSLWILSVSVMGQAEPARQFEVVYSFTVNPAPDNAGTMRLWVPLAGSGEGQRILSRDIRLPVEYRITRDAQYGNEILYSEWSGTTFPKEMQGEIRYWVEIQKPLQKNQKDIKAPEQYLKPTRFVAHGQEIVRLSHVATDGKKSPGQKARGVYDYVIANMRYDKIAPGWGQGDSLRACSVGAGNCTDFHSLFIAMAQTASIPARFKIGLTVPREAQGEIPGYHCWAEFYDEQAGWVPVDASEAWKKPDRKEFYFGGFDADKFLVSIGRDVRLVPQQQGPPVNIFFYPYLEIDGKQQTAVQTAFRFKSA